MGRYVVVLFVALVLAFMGLNELHKKEQEVVFKLCMINLNYKGLSEQPQTKLIKRRMQEIKDYCNYKKEQHVSI